MFKTSHLQELVRRYSSMYAPEPVEESGTKEDHVKHECPKCKGEGCEHCDGKGYHVEDEDEDPVGKNEEVEIEEHCGECEMGIEEEVADLTIQKDVGKVKVNQVALKVVENARRFGLKASLVGNNVRISGPKKKVNDFLDITIGRSSTGDATQKGPSNPQIDKMLTKGLKKEEVEEGWKKGKYTIKDNKGKILGTYSSGGKAQKAMDDLMQKGDYDKLTVALVGTKSIWKNEEVKHECPKCKGEGCDHCDGKGYHLEDEDEDPVGNKNR